MTKKIFIIVLLLKVNFSFAQKKDTASDVFIIKPEVSSNSDQIFTIVEKMPDFQGGETKKSEYIKNNLKLSDETQKGVTGSEFVTFVVNKDGTISNAKILRGISGCPTCDKEAIRLVTEMPNWIPGEQNGTKVRVQYNIRIRFN